MDLLLYLKLLLLVLVAVGVAVKAKKRRVVRFSILLKGLSKMNTVAVGGSLLATIPLDQAFDAAGNPDATFTQPPVWSATPDGVVELTAAPGGLSCAVKALKPGTATVTATAVGDNNVTASADATVTSGPVVKFSVVLGPVPA